MIKDLRLHAFASAMQAHNLDAVEAALAQNVVLVSPITSRFRFEGRQHVAEVISVVLEALRDYRVVDQLGSDDHLAILWRASVNGQEIEGVDTLQCDMHGQVLEITVFVRPLPGLASFTEMIAGRLARKRSPSGALAASMLVAPLAFLTRTGEPIVAKLTRPGPART